MWLALGMEKGKQDLPEPCAPVGCCPFTPSVHSSLYILTMAGQHLCCILSYWRKFSLRSHLSIFYICLLYIAAATQPLVSLLELISYMFLSDHKICSKPLPLFCGVYNHAVNPTVDRQVISYHIREDSFIWISPSDSSHRISLCVKDLALLTCLKVHCRSHASTDVAWRHATPKLPRGKVVI